jgi:hypothetical protein
MHSVVLGLQIEVAVYWLRLRRDAEQWWSWIGTDDCHSNIDVTTEVDTGKTWTRIVPGYIPY